MRTFGLTFIVEELVPAGIVVKRCCKKVVRQLVLRHGETVPARHNTLSDRVNDRCFLPIVEVMSVKQEHEHRLGAFRAASQTLGVVIVYPVPVQGCRHITKALSCTTG